MKRVFFLLSFFLLCWLRPALGQDSSSNASSIAAKQESEERYKRMAADVQAVQSDNESLHAKISALEQELQTLRDVQSKPNDNSAVTDQLKKLAEKIQEVDRKRLEDKETISEEIRNSTGKIEKILHNEPDTAAHSPSKSKTATIPTTGDGTPAPASQDGYSYTILDGDTLGAIVKAYNTDFKSKGLKTITMKQTREANPKVDWNRLKVGQKIIVPKPAGS